MSAPVQTSEPKARLAFLDLLRGWALLVMIEVHVFNAFILRDLMDASWFQVLHYVNGLVAPSFIFISGFVFLIASQRKLESFRAYGSAFWRQIGRIGLIWVVGYFLHIPFFSLHRTITETTAAGWLKFYQADVLHCIALGLLILFLSRLVIQSDRKYRIFLLTSGFFVLLATPFVWNIDFLGILPAPVAAYMNSWHYSLFPVFPWLAFMLFGGYYASGYMDARQQQKEPEFIRGFILTGTIILFVCATARGLHLDVPVGSMDVRANPLFFLERMGIVMILLSGCWYYAKYRKTEKSVVLDVGKESLLVYAAHLLVIYGEFWNDKSLAFYYGKSFGVMECIAGTLVLVLIMVGAAKLWSWLKRNHTLQARIAFWLFTGGIMLWYCLH